MGVLRKWPTFVKQYLRDECMEEISPCLGKPRFPQSSVSCYIAWLRGHLSALHPLQMLIAPCLLEVQAVVDIQHGVMRGMLIPAAFDSLCSVVHHSADIVKTEAAARRYYVMWKLSALHSVCYKIWQPWTCVRYVHSSRHSLVGAKLLGTPAFLQDVRISLCTSSSLPSPL